MINWGLIITELLVGESEEGGGMSLCRDWGQSVSVSDCALSRAEPNWELFVFLFLKLNTITKKYCFIVCRDFIKTFSQRPTKCFGRNSDPLLENRINRPQSFADSRPFQILKGHHHFVILLLLTILFEDRDPICINTVFAFLIPSILLRPKQGK